MSRKPPYTELSHRATIFLQTPEDLPAVASTVARQQFL